MTPQEDRDFIRRLSAQRQRQGKPPLSHPAATAELDERFADLWEAFLDLKSSAGCGMAPEPVTPSDALAWCEIHGIPAWRRRMFWRVVHHLDTVHRAESRKAEKHDHPTASD